MENETHRSEWSEAQELNVSVDLVKAAKQQLRFLAIIDDMPYLYDGPSLDHAIYRYNYCWLPLLAEHLESPLTLEPLVVPLDCEWIWHCNRLNPVQYKIDCEKAYGKILDNFNVLSSTEGSCTKQTELVWNRFYPTELYILDQGCSFMRAEETQGSIQYDLVAAVKRQTSFFEKVSMMHDDSFLEEAVARYKAFLRLIKRTEERSTNCLCVPTHDIDLIWHTHQLFPVSYSNDLKAITGDIIDHNDRDADGLMLETGFLQTAKFWEDTFGKRYFSGTYEMYESAKCVRCFKCGVILTACA